LFTSTITASSIAAYDAGHASVGGGALVGTLVGAPVGAPVGRPVGIPVGSVVGNGSTPGTPVGIPVGNVVGIAQGTPLGFGLQPGGNTRPVGVHAGPRTIPGSNVGGGVLGVAVGPALGAPVVVGAGGVVATLVAVGSGSGVGERPPRERGSQAIGTSRSAAIGSMRRGIAIERSRPLRAGSAARLERPRARARPRSRRLTKVSTAPRASRPMPTAWVRSRSAHAAPDFAEKNDVRYGRPKSPLETIESVDDGRSLMRFAKVVALAALALSLAVPALAETAKKPEAAASKSADKAKDDTKKPEEAEGKKGDGKGDKKEEKQDDGKKDEEKKPKGEGPKADKAAVKGKAKEEREALKAKLGKTLKGKPAPVALKEELKRHARRIARLERIAAIAKDEKDDAVAGRVTKLVEKENARSAKWMAKFEADFDKGAEK
jgi:uncharacterized low-complexity protein